MRKRNRNIPFAEPCRRSTPIRLAACLLSKLAATGETATATTLNKPRMALMAALVAVGSIFMDQAAAQGADKGGELQKVDPFPATFADPAVPLLQLPAKFRARRTNVAIAAAAGKPVEIFNAKGAGCVRHVWFVFAEKNLDDAEIEITVDDAPEPQVRMPFRSFFGALLGFEDYHIDSAGLANFPNFTLTNDPTISPKAQPGWNLYLPIPFSKGCRMTLRSESPKNGGSMIDWQQYQPGVELTPLRFHAQHHIALPASPSQPFPIAETEGTGFLAGYIQGLRQKDHADMVFHNSGTRLYIDGQTDPHVIGGCNGEDDFGFSWGFNEYQTRWVGCPYRNNRGRNDQDGVFYRFFGPDPIPFQSSLIFTTNARADDYEAVSYFYKVLGSKAPQVLSPDAWQVVGPFADGNDLAAFKLPADDIVRQLSQTQLPEKVTLGTSEFVVCNLTSKYGWLRLDNTFQRRTPYPLTEHSVYVRAILHSDTERQAVLRLCLDDWAIIYLNGKQVTMLDHAKEFETAKIPIVLKQGDNPLLIKTNNRLSSGSTHAWAINCVVEPAP